jgi:hypothetical protein
MAKGFKYLVIVDWQGFDGLEWEEQLTQSTAICHTLSHAYELALSMARVSDPDRSYRYCLERIKIFGAVQVRQHGDRNGATIVRVRVHGK